MKKFIIPIAIVLVIVIGCFIICFILVLSTFNKTGSFINLKSIKEPDNLEASLLNKGNFSYPGKEWRVKFNMDIDPLSINEQNFYIKNAKTKTSS